MNHWLRVKGIGLLVYVAIAALVGGGLGWVTLDALGLEREKWEERADTKQYEQLRLALWRLDSRISPVLAREDSRPYNHFHAVYAPPVALQRTGGCWAVGSVLEVSPLVRADLPDWILLHFQADTESGWSSPEVLSPALMQRLQPAQVEIAAPEEAGERMRLFMDLSRHLKPAALLERLKKYPSRLEDTAVLLSNLAQNNPNQPMPQMPQGQINSIQAPNQGPDQQPPSKSQRNSNPLNPRFNGAFANNAEQGKKVDQDYLNRLGQQYLLKQEVTGKNNDKAMVSSLNKQGRNGENWFTKEQKPTRASEQVAVGLGTMVPMWVTTDDDRKQLLVVRRVRVGDKEACQGLLLDWARLQDHLSQEVSDLFSETQFEPVLDAEPEHSERTMSALPVALVPPAIDGEPVPAWSPLRVGLALAWAAALVALAAVGLGGWTLLDLSERRIRFVSAVTHELRTPMTTLRLYLDMLTGGIVQDEKQRSEYLHTLHTETERLNRLVSNVLDFSRLENQRPRLDVKPIAVAELLEQVRTSWQGRCDDTEKLLIIEDRTEAGSRLATDLQLLPQILGNLIDNACKYSQGAEDRRIWLRARRAGRRLVLEVEDRGPGVAPGERRSVFRAFRRGRGTDTTGGVGLGLALARRWAKLLGGALTVHAGADGGACFRLELNNAGAD